MPLTEVVPIDSLILDVDNVRKHNKKNLDAIKGSLKRFGLQKPIVVSSDNVVIAGNGTLEAAKALGWDTISIVRSKLKGIEAVAYAVADNRTGELASWNDELAGALDMLKMEKFELAEIGFDDADLTKLAKSSEDKPIKEKELPTNTECPSCGYRL